MTRPPWTWPCFVMALMLMYGCDGQDEAVSDDAGQSSAHTEHDAQTMPIEIGDAAALDASGGKLADAMLDGSERHADLGVVVSKPPSEAGLDAASDARASDAEPVESEAGQPPQALPAALQNAGVLALFPAAQGRDVCPDPPLRIRFASPPALGSSGKIQVFDAAQPSVAVASVDMALTSTTDTRGGVRFNMPRPAYVDGTEAVIYLPAQALRYGHSYFVRIQGEAIKTPAGTALAITDEKTWTFRVASAAPGNVSELRVALDGMGAFCSVQGAVDAASSGPSVITIARGTYHGIVYFNAKRELTLRGEDRKATILTGTNNDTMNPGTAKRALIGVDASSGIAFANLTIRNLTPQGGSQAEALRMQNCDRCVVRDADILSLQDTLLWSGRIYAKNCFIAGNVDFVWGTGAAYFDSCEIKTVGRKGYIVQARNGADGYGYVFVDSKLTSDPGVSGNLLARIEADRFPASHVAFIDCQIGSHIDPVGWQVTGVSAGGLRFWEYRSKNESGGLIDVSRRLPGSKQLSAEQAASMRNPSMVLGGWSPDLK